MNNPESIEGSSCKRQENGDVSTVVDRPLKKARFAWQVKGKYHLRNETPENSNPCAVLNESDRAGTSSDMETLNSNDNAGNAEQNLEILGDYLLKQDFNTLDSVISDSEHSSVKAGSSFDADQSIQYPKYSSRHKSIKNKGFKSPIKDFTEDDMVSMTMVMSHTYIEDQCIARWQARQMAKGFVDNTINRVLDSWMVTPLPAEVDNNRFLALDVADFINNLPGDNSIENEGILMAISAHGLHNTSCSSSNDNQSSEELSFSSCANDDDIFLPPPRTPHRTTEGEMITLNELNSHEQNDNDRNTYRDSHLGLRWTFSNEMNGTEEMSSLTLLPESSISSCQCFGDSDHLQTNKIDYNTEVNKSDENNDLNSHFDFMDAAVSFAIQNKGLTSFGTDLY